MHRVSDGWHLVGQVALDDADLTGELDRLRVMAKILEPSGILTKLLIPNDQIKYLALDTTRAEEDDVRKALHEATPYDVDDLVYDYVRGGGRTYVAAVAKKTLTEAKQFSTEHGFDPISFAAVPEPFTYVGEAFFGSVDGLFVERDTDSVIITGEATQSVAEPDIPIKPNEIAIGYGLPEANIKLELRPVPDVGFDTQTTIIDAFIPSEPDIDLTLTPDENKFTATLKLDTLIFDEANIDALDKYFPHQRMMQDNGAGLTSNNIKLTPEATDANDTAAQMFSSRLRADRNEERPAPTQIIKRQANKRSIVPARLTLNHQTPQTSTSPNLFVPIGKRTKRMPSLSAPNRTADKGAVAPLITIKKPNSDVGFILTGNAPTNLLPDAAIAAASLNIESIEPPGHTYDNDHGQSAKLNKKRSTGATAFGAASTVGGAFSSMFASRRVAMNDAKTNATKINARSDTTDIRYSTKNKKSKLTFFSARKEAKNKPKVAIGGKPRFLGLVLTAVLLLFLLTMAAVAALSEENFASWFGLKTSATQIAYDPTPTSALEAAAPQTAYYKQLVATRNTTNLLPKNVAHSLATGEQILTPQEAARLYAAIGVWQRAPRIPQIPRTTKLNTITHSVLSHPVHLIQSSPLKPYINATRDTLIATPTLPPPPSQSFDYNADGLVLATTQGALTPDGILVIAGRPPLNPPKRPRTLAIEITTQHQLSGVISQDANPINDSPVGVILIVGRPTITPPIRSRTLPTFFTPKESALASSALTLLATDDLLVLTGSPPILPPVRPKTITPSVVVAPEMGVPNTSPRSVNNIAGSLPLFRPDRQGTGPPRIDTENLKQSISAVPTFIAQVPTSDTPRPLPRPSAVIKDAAEISAAQAVTENITVLGVLNDAQASAFRPRTRLAERKPILDVSVAQPAVTGLRTSRKFATSVLTTTSLPNPIVNATTQAVKISSRPDLRPRNMARIVLRAIDARENAAKHIAATTVALQTVSPSRPTAGSVAQAATLHNTINLEEMNLIGIYGGSGDRRALLRMNNGRYVRVTVGDHLDGGRVTAISATALNYTKRGRAITLRVIG